MSWMEIVKRELAQARQELAAAEEGLKAGTPAAHGRRCLPGRGARLHGRADREATGDCFTLTGPVAA